MPSFQFTLGSVVVLGTALGLATFALWYQKRRNASTEIPTTSKTGVSLPPEPFYLPFLEDNGTVKMGVKALKPEDVWIDIGGSYHDQMSTKKQVLDAHWDEVWVSKPGSSTETAKREALDLIVQYILTHYPNFFRMKGDCILFAYVYIYFDLQPYIYNNATQEYWRVKGTALDKDPLLIASLLIQEDLCILEQEADEGAIVLTAGCVCFPMRWSLKEKFTKELTMIHEPVQPFTTHLAGPAVKALKNLKTPIWRANWSLFDDLKSTLDLYTPTSSAQRATEKAVLNVDELGEVLFYRSERQTLSRLPSGAILFTIRTIQHPLKSLLLYPSCEAQRARLEDKEKVIHGLINAMRVMDPTFREYRGANKWIDITTQYLQAQLAK